MSIFAFTSQLVCKLAWQITLHQIEYWFGTTDTYFLFDSLIGNLLSNRTHMHALGRRHRILYAN